MHLTLSYVAENPSTLTKAMPIASGEEIVLRPLDASDLQGLTVFLERLSPETRHFCIYPGYDRTAAREFCDAINRYDKLRLVLDEPSSGKIIGLLEYSFDIPEGDFKRFANYAVQLNAATDCRFGPCLSDDYQNIRSWQCYLPICRGRCAKVWEGETYSVGRCTLG